ncbi:globin family protein [Allocoleopsis franciscana]|uniref:Hemoglobin-like flavoprotein n=1 Tax=Allocoleopsis franciscana PCC 7113 TaxID=1173027 RepID=K9WGN6_9CYAN|nr:globin domain-containing protein [Allocoleopsis franciscana]AFZ18672.1 hemoglobin-like flavoprotein [Allocoleopsis franciscana PCC 7113]
MPAKDFLNSVQKKQLQQTLRDSEQPHLREGCLILLLINDGKTAREITDLLGCSFRTVAYWQFNGFPENLESLPDEQELEYRPDQQEPEYLAHQRERRNSHKALEDFIPLSDIKVLEVSFALIQPQATEFASKFYKNLFTDYPQLQPLFAYTHIEVQEKKLITALVLVINNLRKLTYLKNILKDLGTRHVRYGTIQEHYPMVGGTLLKTLESFLGKEWTPEVKRAWTHGYKAIANLMQEEH